MLKTMTIKTKPTKILQQLLKSNQLEFIMEAHNGLSAKIVEEAGFKGIWASGLSISAQWGVRDNNEASWTQVLEVVEFMADAVNIPILLDGDTGYGNFNNAQRLVRKLEQRQIAGVCLEDKLFPKTNSFIKGHGQPLADIDEFSGKIKAAKDAQLDDDFVIVARVEAFIAGWGLKEAIKRADAYHNAGADAILIHSALRIPDEILAFKKEWGNRCPVVIVPTKYYATPTSVFRDNQFSLIIWANHLLRASVANMQKIATQLHSEENLLNVEDEVVAVEEIFRLQGATELLEAEKRYLPDYAKKAHAVLLSVFRGADYCCVANPTIIEFDGQSFLSKVADVYKDFGIKDISVVPDCGRKEVNLPDVQPVEDVRCTSELFSLHKALIDKQDSNVLIASYNEVLFKKYILDIVFEHHHDFIIVVDADWQDVHSTSRLDYVRCSAPNSKQAFFSQTYLEEIVPSTDGIHGLWTGLFKASGEVRLLLQEVLEDLLKDDKIRAEGRMPLLINELIKRGQKVEVIYITGHWLEVEGVEVCTGKH